MMVSTFQHPFYPHSGVEGRSERMVNVPLAAYSGGREFRAAVERYWLPALEAFAPEMLFVSAGFDAHATTTWRCSTWLKPITRGLTGKIRDIAERHGAGASFQCSKAAMNCTRLAAALPHIQGPGRPLGPDGTIAPVSTSSPQASCARRPLPRRKRRTAPLRGIR